MIIEKSVADQQLCTRLSGDEFLSSAYAWVLGSEDTVPNGRSMDGGRWVLVNSNASFILAMREKGDIVYPAPNLSEILEVISALPNVYDIGLEKTVFGWRVSCLYNPCEILISEDFSDEFYSKLEFKKAEAQNASDASLSLYFDIRGNSNGRA